MISLVNEQGLSTTVRNNFVNEAEDYVYKVKKFMSELAIACTVEVHKLIETEVKAMQTHNVLSTIIKSNRVPAQTEAMNKILQEEPSLPPATLTKLVDSRFDSKIKDYMKTNKKRIGSSPSKKAQGGQDGHRSTQNLGQKKKKITVQPSALKQTVRFQSQKNQQQKKQKQQKQQRQKGNHAGSNKGTGGASKNKKNENSKGSSRRPNARSKTRANKQSRK